MRCRKRATVADVKRLQWVGTRQGKRVIHWPQVCLMFVALVLAMTLVRRGCEWIWNLAEPEHQIESWRSTIVSAMTAAVSLLVVFLFFAWKRPAACVTECDDSARPLAD